MPTKGLFRIHQQEEFLELFVLEPLGDEVERMRKMVLDLLGLAVVNPEKVKEILGEDLKTLLV